jgi:hypothetical protein
MARKRKTAVTEQAEPQKSPAPPPEPPFTDEERALLGKLPGLSIVPGSLGPAPEKGAGKRAVTIVCACGGTRRVATSDLHQTFRCLACQAEHARQRRREARQDKRKGGGR